MEEGLEVFRFELFRNVTKQLTNQLTFFLKCENLEKFEIANELFILENKKSIV